MDFLRVGVISNTHGIKGEVKVFPTTDDPERFEVASELYRTYLNKCAFLADSGDDVKANTLIDDVANPYYIKLVEIYVEMTNWLANKYGIENTFDNSVVFSDDEVTLMGHGSPEEELRQREASRTMKR